MISVDYKLYSEAFITRAISAALAQGLSDEAPLAGGKSFNRFGLSVQTPKGEMIAYSSYEGDEYPGIAVDIIPQDDIIGLATCEVDSTQENRLQTHIFADADDDSPTHTIYHYGDELGGERCSNQ